MSQDATDQRMQFAAMIDVPNEKLGPVKVEGGFLWAMDTRNGVWWTVKLTPTGRIKKNSERMEGAF